MTRRDQTVIATVLVIALAVGAWLAVVQPKRDKASKLASQVTSVRSELDQVQTQMAQGQAARNAFAGSYTDLARLGEAVPADDNVPSLIYQIQSAAAKAHVGFDSLSLASSAASSSSATPTTPAHPGSSSSTGSSSTGSSSSTGGSAAATTLPPGASIGPAGFPIEPFTFTFSGNFFHLSDFFGRLQRFVVATEKKISVSGRLMTLDAISLAASSTGFPNITATMSATTFLLPSSQGLTAGATPLGPAETSASSALTASAGSATAAPAGSSAPATTAGLVR